jgi:hypothetical protein
MRGLEMNPTSLTLERHLSAKTEQSLPTVYTRLLMKLWFIGFDSKKDLTYIYFSIVHTLMNICSRCRVENMITYSCEHTNEKQMCKECYQYIHWLLNSNIPENQKES